MCAWSRGGQSDLTANQPLLRETVNRTLHRQAAHVASALLRCGETTRTSGLAEERMCAWSGDREFPRTLFSRARPVQSDYCWRCLRAQRPISLPEETGCSEMTRLTRARSGGVRSGTLPRGVVECSARELHDGCTMCWSTVQNRSLGIDGSNHHGADHPRTRTVRDPEPAAQS